MKMLCPACNEAMHIIRSKQVNDDVREFVGGCPSDTCGAKAVMLMSLSHYIQPPKKDLDDAFEALLTKIDPKKRKALLKKYAS